MKNPRDAAIPGVLVNRFRVKNPGTEGDLYIYYPGPPSEIASGNASYVFNGPAFFAWPADRKDLEGDHGTVELFKFRSVGRSPADTSSYYGYKLKHLAEGHWPAMALPLGFSAPTAPPWDAFENPISGPAADEGPISVPALVKQVYEHASGDVPRFIYDFNPKAHDGWGDGVPVFWAAPAESFVNGLAALSDANKDKVRAVTETAAHSIASEFATAFGPLLASAAQPIDIERHSDRVKSFFESKGLPLKIITIGVGADVGIVIKFVWEGGKVMNLKQQKIHGYGTVGGSVSPSAGVSGNVTIGCWWGATEKEVLDGIEGRGLNIHLGATVGLGFKVGVNLRWDDDAGAFTDPFGITLSPQAGLDVEAGPGVAATYTWLYAP